MLPAIMITFVVVIIAGLISTILLEGSFNDLTGTADKQQNNSNSITEKGWNYVEAGPDGDGGNTGDSNGDNGGSEGGGIPGEGAEPSDNVEMDKVERVYFRASEEIEGDDTFDGDYIPIDSSEGELSHDMERDYILGRFYNDYNRENVELEENYGGLERNIWVKNMQTGDNLSSANQDRDGRVSLPSTGSMAEDVQEKTDEYIENTGEGGDINYNSVRLSMLEGDYEWSWENLNMSQPGEENADFSTLYPGENEFKVAVRENGTNAVLKGETFTFETGIDYKIEYINGGNEDDTPLDQPSNPIAWNYTSTAGGGSLTSKKTKNAYRTDDSPDVNPKFKAEFPEDEYLYRLEVRKTVGEGVGGQADPIGETELEDSSQNEVIVESPDESEIEDPLWTDEWGIAVDQSTNGGREADESEFEVTLERSEEGDDWESVHTATFVFEHWCNIEGAAC